MLLLLLLLLASPLPPSPLLRLMPSLQVGLVSPEDPQFDTSFTQVYSHDSLQVAGWPWRQAPHWGRGGLPAALPALSTRWLAGQAPVPPGSCRHR